MADLERMRVRVLGLKGAEEWFLAHAYGFGCPNCPEVDGRVDVLGCKDFDGVARIRRGEWVGRGTELAGVSKRVSRVNGYRTRKQCRRGDTPAMFTEVR